MNPRQLSIVFDLTTASGQVASMEKIASIASDLVGDAGHSIEDLDDKSAMEGISDRLQSIRDELDDMHTRLKAMAHKKAKG